MKNIIIGICSCVFIGILILTIYTLYGRSIRKEELELALANSMRTVMEELQNGDESNIGSKEDLTVLFLENFLTQIDSKSNVRVHILDVDYEKGLLSAEAVAEYTHPIGVKGAVSARKTVILEKVNKKERTQFCCIDYMVEGERYKTYHIQKGEKLFIPTTPVCAGKRFVGWRAFEGEEILILNEEIVVADQKYVAVFEEI